MQLQSEQAAGKLGKQGYAGHCGRTSQDSEELRTYIIGLKAA
jgi:hypothetical protein